MKHATTWVFFKRSQIRYLTETKLGDTRLGEVPDCSEVFCRQVGSKGSSHANHGR